MQTMQDHMQSFLLRWETFFEAFQRSGDPLLMVYSKTLSNEQKGVLKDFLIADVCEVICDYLSCQERPCACFLDLEREKVLICGTPCCPKVELVRKCCEGSCVFAFDFALNGMVFTAEADWRSILDLAREHQDDMFFQLATRKNIASQTCEKM